VVYGSFEHVTRFEGEHPPPANDHFLTGLRIAPAPRPFFPNRKVAKARDLDFLASFQPAFDDLEDRFYKFGPLTARTMKPSTNALDNVALC
jgi:hypothetical protein